MNHETKLTILLEIDEGDRIGDIVSELPDYCASTFANTRGNYWFGEFQISCPVAPKVADGDFVDDFAPYLKTFNSAEYQLIIAVGEPANEFFEMESHSVALLSALGASILVQTAKWTTQTEQAAEEDADYAASWPNTNSSVSQP